MRSAAMRPAPLGLVWVIGIPLASWFTHASAHHGTRISYDWSNPTRLSGVVTEFVWRNPHVGLFFDVEDGDGNLVAWAAEMTSLANLARSGWSRTTLQPGDEITLTIYPSRAGAPVGEVDRETPMFVNGMRLPSPGGTQPARAGSGAPPAVDYAPGDLSGIWIADGGPRRSVTGEAPAPMTPAGQAKYDAQLPSYGPRAIPPALGNDPAAQCNPLGLTRTFLSIRPFEIIQLPDRVVQLFERGRTWREIWTDGRALPEQPDPYWMGHSVGRWEGDTLVVETTGFDERTWLDSFANPHSAAMRLEERWRRVDHDTLELDMVIHDPTMYTEPIVVQTKPYARAPQHRFLEEFCAPADEGSFNRRIRNPAGGLNSAE